MMKIMKHLNIRKMVIKTFEELWMNRNFNSWTKKTALQNSVLLKNFEFCKAVFLNFIYNVWRARLRAITKGGIFPAHLLVSAGRPSPVLLSDSGFSLISV